MSKGKVIAVCTLSVLVSIMIFIGLASGPSRGNITKASDSLNIVKGDTIVLKKITTTYIEFELPDTLTMKSSNESRGNGVYAQYLFSDTRFGSKQQVGVSLGHLNGQVLDEISFVKQRAISPDRYVKVVDTNSSITYRSVLDDEYTTVLVDGEKYVAVASSGTSDEFATLKDVTDGVIRSLRWR